MLPRDVDPTIRRIHRALVARGSRVASQVAEVWPADSDDTALVEECYDALLLDAARHLELDACAGRYVCAWCGEDLGPAETSEASHGICVPCSETLMGGQGGRRE